MDVIKAVAEAKCPGQDGHICVRGIRVSAGPDSGKSGVGCSLCNGTGLRWPSLSRECHTIHSFLENAPSCSECGGTRENPGRVPHVTLEKVYELLLSDETQVVMWRERKTGQCHIRQHAINDEYEDSNGDTPLEVACAALLSTLDSHAIIRVSNE